MMEELLKELINMLKKLSENMEYQQKLLEEIVLAKDEQMKFRDKALVPLKKYREMIKNAEFLQDNPEISQMLDGVLDGLPLEDK